LIGLNHFSGLGQKYGDRPKKEIQLKFFLFGTASFLRIWSSSQKGNPIIFLPEMERQVKSDLLSWQNDGITEWRRRFTKENYNPAWKVTTRRFDLNKPIALSFDNYPSEFPAKEPELLRSRVVSAFTPPLDGILHNNIIKI
jgi:hypothetical protein